MTSGSKAPYPECASCLATVFCKRYRGEVPKPQVPDWCNPKFRLYKALRLSLIPKAYHQANIYGYKKDENNAEVFDRFVPLLENVVEEVKNGTNIVLFGEGTGTGKTYHGTMFLNHYIYKEAMSTRFDFENPLALFIVYPDLMDLLRYSDDKEAMVELVEQIKNVPLLMLDDVGAGTMTNFSREQTYIILNHRFNEGKSTVITSNLTIKQLADDECLGRRNVSRMTSQSEGFELRGADRRRAKRR